jgi:hypothetical protein
VPSQQEIGRRTFLGLAVFVGAMAAVSRLRFPPEVLAAPSPARGTLHALSATDSRILSAVADRITFTGDPEMPRFGETGGLAAIDTALLQLAPDVASQLHWGLVLFEYGPPVFDFRLSTFTGLSDADQDSYLRGWAESRYEIRRLTFRALKNLSMLGYYSQDATWKGIHYGGPWVPRPRRVASPQ